jgi:hypothetical protein
MTNSPSNASWDGFIEYLKGMFWLIVGLLIGIFLVMKFEVN